MFHIIGMNLSLALFGGNVSMVLSELQGIRIDRHLCAAAGICTNFFYTAAAILLMMESHAIFKATTTGIIGGRTRVGFLKQYILSIKTFSRRNLYTPNIFAHNIRIKRNL